MLTAPVAKTLLEMKESARVIIWDYKYYFEITIDSKPIAPQRMTNPPEARIDINSDHLFGFRHHAEGEIACTGADIGHRLVLQITQKGNHQFGFLPDSAVFALLVGNQILEAAFARFRQGYRFVNGSSRGLFFRHKRRRIGGVRRIPSAREESRGAHADTYSGYKLFHKSVIKRNKSREVRRNTSPCYRPPAGLFG